MLFLLSELRHKFVHLFDGQSKKMAGPEGVDKEESGRKNVREKWKVSAGIRKKQEEC